MWGRLVTVTEEMKQAMLAVVDSGRFILGPETKAFEQEMEDLRGRLRGIRSLV